MNWFLTASMRQGRSREGGPAHDQGGPSGGGGGASPTPSDRHRHDRGRHHQHGDADRHAHPRGGATKIPDSPRDWTQNGQLWFLPTALQRRRGEFVVFSPLLHQRIGARYRGIAVAAQEISRPVAANFDMFAMGNIPEKVMGSRQTRHRRVSRAISHARLRRPFDEDLGRRCRPAGHRNPHLTADQLRTGRSRKSEPAKRAMHV